MLRFEAASSTFFSIPSFVSGTPFFAKYVKQVANQELVTTSNLGDKIGDKNASALIANIKDDFAKNGVPDTKEGIEKKVDDAASNLNKKETGTMASGLFLHSAVRT